ncbi:MAG: hypothetical protein A2107_15550 [Verrucomicrobia bacterium GWF2_62_7]|nr:MAG: hypothetical protein A2107_15550 [Verrucomicrobia bacterium GWF2_62_7]
MSVFDQLSREAAKRQLDFLVIGAHAVICHGFVRATDDADILVRKENRSQWEEMLRGFGYNVIHDGGSFLQFESTDETCWDLDLMLVPAETFWKMFAEAKVVKLGGVSVRIPSLEHLFALKIHALKHGRGLRRLKDMDDVIRLALANGVDVRSESFRKLFVKYGDLKVYEQVLQACGS